MIIAVGSSLYDVVINIGLVTGVTLAAFTSPASGQSPFDLLHRRSVDRHRAVVSRRRPK